jgi:hypothetical protein
MRLTALFFDPLRHAPHSKVVPTSKYGIHKVNRLKFYYLGWEPDESYAVTFVRGTANRECLKLADWKGCLDANRL